MTQIENLLGSSDELQSQIDTLKTTLKKINLESSYILPVLNVITATTSGGTSVVHVSAHTRWYADGSSVPVSAVNLSGLNPGMTYYIYYLDPDRAGGLVTLNATNLPGVAAQVGDTHVIGLVTTPLVAGVTISGKSIRPPGSNSVDNL